MSFYFSQFSLFTDCLFWTPLHPSGVLLFPFFSLFIDSGNTAFVQYFDFYFLLYEECQLWQATF